MAWTRPYIKAVSASQRTRCFAWLTAGAVRWCGKDEFGIVDFMRPLFAHPACDNPEEDNFTVAAPRIVGRQSDIHPDDEYADRPSLAHHIKR